MARECSPALSVVGTPSATSHTVKPAALPWAPASSRPQGLHARLAICACRAGFSTRQPPDAVLQHTQQLGEAVGTKWIRIGNWYKFDLVALRI